VGHRITGRYRGAVNRHHSIGWEFVHVCIDDASRFAFVPCMSVPPSSAAREASVRIAPGLRLF
jgi:hypothetical protein